MCGREYSFMPSLKPGDLLAGQYEVKGAMAFGGLGWIYLAWDRTLSRWVVLKGLLNTKDEASAAAALAERQFLAAVKHPKIVGVYNFVNHGTEGYIVMEYVGGKTLKALRQERGTLPVAEAVAYLLAILPAFGYLHRQGMVYCDFKPDNCMLEEDDVKLIDMGGVRRLDDLDGDVYGTVGYVAPEAFQTPNVTSDLYTVARTLAILIMDFKFQGTYEFSLPTPQEQPLFVQYDSLYRFLLKATHQEPDERFQTADEMSEQLLGILREITANETTPHPAESVLFFGDTHDGDTEKPDVRLLPRLKTDATDPAASALMVMGSLLDPKVRENLLQRAEKDFPESLEVPLRLAELYITQEKYALAGTLLEKAASLDAFDWRVQWLRGTALLAQGRAQEAYAEFDRVYFDLPGELAPKLALALAAERAGDTAGAIRYYHIVSQTDPNFTSASFGLARCRALQGDRAGAVTAYERVPPTSSHHTQAQMALTRTLLQDKPTAPGADELARASAALEALTLDGFDLHHLKAQVLLTALQQVEAKALQGNGSVKVLGQPLVAQSLRTGIEREFRACARFAPTPEEKIALVDRANRERPRTLL